LEVGESFESNNLTLKTYNQGRVVVDSAVTTGTSFQVVSDSVTTGKGLALSADGLVTGTGIDISSTSTAGGASGTSKLLNLSRSGANTNDAHTAYGLYSAVTNTGTTSTNVGGYFSASGATNNYGLIVESGNVGIGTATPLSTLDVRGTIENGLVAWWSMDEGTGTTIADQSINSNTGALTGGIPDWTNGKFGKGLSFNGSSDYVNVPSSSSFNSSTGTFMAWIKTDEMGAYEGIGYIGQDSNNMVNILKENANNIIIYVNEGGATKIGIHSPYGSLTPGWHQIAVTQDGTSMKIYQDGIEQSLSGTNGGNWTANFSTWDVRIGIDALNNKFDGLIDEVKIYPHRRSKDLQPRSLRP
jgi:hypothetical protein